MSEDHTAQEIDVRAFGLAGLYPAQQRFVFSNAKNGAMFMGGRGTGKSTALCVRVIVEACRNPGGTIGLFAPTFRSLTRVTERMLLEMCHAWTRSTGWSLLKRHYKADHIFVINDCEVYAQSFERVDRIRGLNLGAALIDEIETSRDPVGVVSVISGAVRGGTGSHCLSFATTPRGYRGMCRIFVDHAREKTPGWHLTIARTSDNPWNGGEAFVERLRQTMSRQTFEQEVNAKVLRPSAVCWPEFKRAGRHVVPFSYNGEPIAYAIDWGYSRPHASCWAKVQSSGDPDRLVCFWEFNEDDTPEGVFLDAIYDHAKSIGREPFLCAADRAIPRCNQALMRKWPNARVKTMQSRSEQEVWRGVELVRTAFDPATGPPRLVFAESLTKTKSDRGIIRSVEQLRRRSRDGVLLDEREPNSPESHATDAMMYLAKAFFGIDGGAFYSGVQTVHPGIGNARRFDRRF